MAGLSLNNDFATQKAPPTQLSPPVSHQQQPFGNLPPQPQPQSAYPGKPGMMPVMQQPNAPPINSRPPMPTNSNNPMSYAPPPLPSQSQPVATNGAQSPNQAPPTLSPFNGSTNQYPSQVMHLFLRDRKIFD